MKKKIVFLLVILLAFAITPPLSAIKPIAITVNGKPLVTDTAPIMVNNRVMVPLRAVSEALNCNVSWLPTQQMVAIDEKVVPVKASIPIEGPENFKTLMNESLKKMDPETRKFCCRYLSKIAFEQPATVTELAYVFKNGDVCYINGDAFNKIANNASAPRAGVVMTYLGVIVHEATHSCLDMSRQRETVTEKQAESLCDLAALRAMELAGCSRSSIEYNDFKKSVNANLDY